MSNIMVKQSSSESLSTLNSEYEPFPIYNKFTDDDFDIKCTCSKAKRWNIINNSKIMEEIN